MNRNRCGDCKNWIGGGDWGLSCSKDYYIATTNPNREACDKFEKIIGYDKSKGRRYALLNKKCPQDIGGICADCPSGCPLRVEVFYCENFKYIIGRNNPERHPECFEDEYKALYPNDEFELDFNTNNGYYLMGEPAHWKQFVKEINDVCFGS